MRITLFVFDRKPAEIVDCRTLCAAGLPLWILHWSQLKIALFQPPSGTSITAFVIAIINLISAGTHYSLQASRRLAVDLLLSLMRRPRPRGTWPTLSELIKTLVAFKARPGSKEGFYRESLLYALKALHYELGDCINYARSDMVDRMLETSGVFVIDTHDLSPPAASFVAAYIMYLAVQYRRRPGADPDHYTFFMFDDATDLVRGSVATETESGTNPITDVALMGRSLKIGVFVLAHDFSQLSPALLSAARTCVLFRTSGRSAIAAARHLQLSPDQARMIPSLPVGHAIVTCPDQPTPVLGVQPEVP